ncbi:MAG: ketopantoate reductase C-terminal domain-containing protein [Methyloceanibacter sp.]|uniref:ketopantoate reductase C-terminal domain-containing protein n=1 Tax=Methyloceanibacter sp. TaxID=1965321 RepID=UPI003D9B9BF2
MLSAVRIKVAPVEGIPLRLIALALRLPDWLFKRAAHKMLVMDASARSSMLEDLKMGRLTEIDCIQGAVMRRAEALCLDVPLTRRVMQLIRDAERARRGSPALSPNQVETCAS